MVLQNTILTLGLKKSRLKQKHLHTAGPSHRCSFVFYPPSVMSPVPLSVL